MNITSKTLASVCVALLVLYPISAIVVQAIATADDYYGVLAALFAVNAGTALLVGFTFGLPQFSDHTSRALRFFVGAIGVVCALMSGVYWMTDEIDNAWLSAGIISPIVVILFLLMRFIYKVNKERPENEGE